MVIQIMKCFEPDINPDHTYAVAVTTNGPLILIATYPTAEQLETAYQDWVKYAEERGKTKPIPVEILNSDLEVRVLSDLMSD